MNQPDSLQPPRPSLDEIVRDALPLPEAAPAERPARPLPSDARARRRRAHRTLFPSDTEGQVAMLADLARRAYPSYELYILALFSGGVLSLGYAFDAPAVLIFGALSAPLLTPWVGLTLASITGSIRFFAQTFAALIVSLLIVFLIGLAAGFATTPFQPMTLNQVYLHSRLWWPDLVVLAFASILLVITFVRTDQRPYLPSAMVAYEFFLPISAAGFGIGAGLDGVWPQAVLVFLVYLAWATFFGIITFAFMRFRPLTTGGLAFSGILILVIAATLIVFTGIGQNAYNFILGTASPAPLASAPTFSPEPASLRSPTGTGAPSPSATLRPNATVNPNDTQPAASGAVSPTLLGGDITFAPTETVVPTFTFEPTPVLAKINAVEGGGAYMRKNPAGKFLATLENGVIVEVLGETQEVSGVTWVKIAAIKNGMRMEGWIIQSVLVTATPVVNWQPSATPTITP
jgi:hypothetical protein